VDHLQHITGHNDFIVLCIYCNYKEQIAQTLPNLIGALIKQCIQISGRVSPHLKSLYDSHKEKARETLAFLQELVQILSSGLGNAPAVYIVTDALDEYQHAQRLIEHLSALPHRVKLMFTSRTTPPSWFEVDSSIAISAPDEDIQSYITHRTQELHVLKGKGKEAMKQATVSEISNRVIEQSRGM
jgi:hypothetical protein